MELKYVGPSEEVNVPSLGVNVKQGETIEVSAAVAGRAYSEKRGKDGETVVDLGEGLLAQHDNWQPVKEAKKP